jgi:hypothetical protein
MTIKTLLNLILKIIGLYFIKDILQVVSQLLSMVYYFTKSESIMEVVWAYIPHMIFLLVFVFISYLFILKTDLIIKLLKLDRGFDEQLISFKIHRSSILSISIIVISGLIIINEIPNLCQQLILCYKERIALGEIDQSFIGLILPSVKIIIGSFILSYQKLIVNYIEHKQRVRV